MQRRRRIEASVVTQTKQDQRVIGSACKHDHLVKMSENADISEEHVWTFEPGDHTAFKIQYPTYSLRKWPRTLPKTLDHI